MTQKGCDRDSSRGANPKMVYLFFPSEFEVYERENWAIFWVSTTIPYHVIVTTQNGSIEKEK